MSMSSYDPVMEDAAMHQASGNALSRVQSMMGDTDKQPKGDVDYRVSNDPAESCGVCVHFDGSQGCEVVAGTIDPRGVSNAFEPAEPSTAIETEAEAPLA